MGHVRPSAAQEKLRRMKIRETTWLGTEKRLKEIEWAEQVAEEARRKRAQRYLAQLTEIHKRKHPQ